MPVHTHTTYARDSFARMDHVRRIVHTPLTCDWCGNERHAHPGTLFQYGHHDDDRTRPTFDTHVFCSVSCYRTYHDLD